ncbi:maleylpyruvate isomerase family mycothiol-dependent enzyme [Cellulomonas aerilata]|uniref:Mycothiol-dependent maleylpyruvate isomerase metal-binding domain-containing protein n=1 Tax=Cellulomonas aerilata TaxID=515326 RepID=A0A512D937_9CELL|nr:maleylpyruvate isomerase family mycothiol-dependent enzyme [Cellulomonas aerilata]GEO33003.1 hypothetical protein CAE01nite_07280 [Cellulomonas aerilata]
MTTPRPTAPLDHLVHLAELQRAFARTVPAVDPQARVPWCGRWRVHHLVVHLARIHHWAAAQARRTCEVPLGRGPFELEPFYRRCAAELRDTLVELGPDAVGSTLLGPGPASFWRRRQLHEALVHLWDLRTAGGLPLDVDPALWADTVDEVVTVMQPRQVRMGRMDPLPAPVALVATDAGDRTWTLGPGGGDQAGVRAGMPAGAQVTGPAQGLALLLWGRAPADDPSLAVTGDRAVLVDTLSRRLTP